MAIERFSLAPDKAGNNTLVRTAPAYIDTYVLAASTNETITVPAGADTVLFSADGTFYAKPNGAAAVAGTDVTGGSGSEMNPTAWQLRTGGTQAAPNGTAVATIGLIAPAARIVTLSFYRQS